MASKTVKLMVDGTLEECLVRVDGNGEWACKARSGRVFFFAPTERVNTNPESEATTEEDQPITLAEHVKRHNAANSTAPVFAHEVEDTTDEEWDNWDAASAAAAEGDAETPGRGDAEPEEVQDPGGEG